MALKAILFDVGGTIVLPDMDRLMAPLLERGVKPTPDQLREADKAAKFSRPADQDDSAVNRGHWYIYFSRLLEQVGHADLLEVLTERAGDSSYWSVPAPHAAEVLDSLKNQYRLGVISNADGKIETVLELAGLKHYFESITDSGLVGFEKPDRRIFDAALTEMRLDASDCLYIGDIHGIDYSGATGAGMHAVIVDYTGIYDGSDFPTIGSLRELPLWAQRPVAKSKASAVLLDGAAPV